ncbi:hypothetical protein Tdes44962_MAKER04775 [Teratosphaeria destructans]|uniref:Transmembrane protein n=1 Tax=Teratosphaeria destructans TaxID=418781 RepID=A0A9W7VZH5_9PEZI|nr:hypothetical protein Tdes44962_MAKER04775 [Teratosphaeria destructans]
MYLRAFPTLSNLSPGVIKTPTCYHVRMADKEQQDPPDGGRRDSVTDAGEALSPRETRLQQLQQALAATPPHDAPARHHLEERIQDLEAFQAELGALEAFQAELGALDDDNSELRLQCVKLEALLKIERRRVFFSRAAMLLCIVSVIVGAIAVVMGGGEETCIVVPERLVNYVD